MYLGWDTESDTQVTIYQFVHRPTSAQQCGLLFLKVTITALSLVSTYIISSSVA